MVAPNTQLWRISDRLAGGRLAERIAELREGQASPELISKTLFADFGIEVTRQTVGVWCDQLDDEPEPVDAA